MLRLSQHINLAVIYHRPVGTILLGVRLIICFQGVYNAGPEGVLTEARSEREKLDTGETTATGMYPIKSINDRVGFPWKVFNSGVELLDSQEPSHQSSREGPYLKKASHGKVVCVHHDWVTVYYLEPMFEHPDHCQGFLVGNTVPRLSTTYDTASISYYLGARTLGSLHQNSANSTGRGVGVDGEGKGKVRKREDWVIRESVL